MSNHVSTVTRWMCPKPTFLCHRHASSLVHRRLLPCCRVSTRRSLSTHRPLWQSGLENVNHKESHRTVKTAHLKPDESSLKQSSNTAASRHHPVFAVRLNRLPLNAALISHLGSSEHLRREFTKDLTSIFRDYCEGQTIEALRRKYQQQINNADTTFKTTSLPVLSNWLDTIFNDWQRARTLVDLLAGSILTSPEQLLQVLSCLKELEDDFEVRISCLYFVGYLYKHELLQDPNLMLKFDAEIDRLRSPHRWPPSRISYDHLRLLLWRSTQPQIQSLLDALASKYSTFSTKTTRLLVEFCAKSDMPEQAIGFLRFLPDVELQNPDQDLLKACMHLIRNDAVVHTENGPNFKYLAYLLGRGLKPDALLYSRIVSRAVECGYPAVAWDIFHYAKSLDVSVHPRAYLSLLKNAFQTQNLAEVDEILSEVSEDVVLHGNRELILYSMNMVRRLNHAQGQTTAADGLSHLLTLYDRIYSRQSLARFGFVKDNSDARHDGSKQTPDKYALSFTVWAYVLCHKSGSSFQYLWHDIARLADQGDPVVQECLSVDLLYNAFIWLNLRQAANLSQALEVFSYMVEKEFCLPTHRTWSILICGFLYQNEKEKAKNIYHLMQNHGFKLQHICQEYFPSGVTYADLERRMYDILDEENMLTVLQEDERPGWAYFSTLRGDQGADDLGTNIANKLVPDGIPSLDDRESYHDTSRVSVEA